VAANRRTTIELNGSTYDAITGELIDAAPTPQESITSPVKSTQPVNSSGSMDGMVAQPNPPKPRPNPQSAHGIHNKTKRSQTLNRTAVAQQKPPLAASGVAKKHPVSHESTKPALAGKINQHRARRAAGVTTNQAIKKFSAAPATEAPTTADNPQPAPRALEPSAKNKLIAEQLLNAEAHKESPPARASLRSRFLHWLNNGRTRSVVATSFVALIVIGYVTYINIPRMALRVASSRAGFSAELPGYAPPGFKLSGPVAYSPGQITIEYTANTDDRTYTINQKETSWDSRTLLDNYVSQETELYSTYQERGLTVYMFDGNTATWVNGGVWFTVNSDAKLSADQMLKIAASL
jgi:hypothetical protein